MLPARDPNKRGTNEDDEETPARGKPVVAAGEDDRRGAGGVRRGEHGGERGSTRDESRGGGLGDSELRTSSLRFSSATLLS